MKIILITRFYKPDTFGGIETYVSNIAEKLKERGHEVIVLTLSKGNKGYVEEINGVVIYRIHPLNVYNPYFYINQPLPLKVIHHALDLFNPHSYLLVKKILSKEKPDVVHINSYKGLSVSVFKGVRELKIPLVFTVHDYSTICIRTNLLNSKGEICENPRIPCKLYNRVQRYLIDDKPDVVTAPSEFVIKQLEKAGMFRDTEKFVLPNPVKPGNMPVEKFYETMDILFVGSLSRHKGPDILIRAFKEIEGDNLRLHILGKGPDEGEVRRLAEGDERISDERIIFHGFMSGDELMNMYRMANVTVVPSICYETFGLVILESFMNSTPVIASRIGGIPELVRDGYNGFLFEPGSVNGLRRILEEISEDPSILKELEKNAYESSRGYSIEDHVKKLEEIYRGLL